MKDYSATITVTIGFRAQNEDQAEERAQALADRITLGPDDKGKTDYPSWYDDSSWEVNSPEVECND